MIINESLLSYMSLGINPPKISLGNIMSDARGYIASDAWYIMIPGIVLIIMVLGLNLSVTIFRFISIQSFANRRITVWIIIQKKIQM